MVFETKFGESFPQANFVLSSIYWYYHDSKGGGNMSYVKADKIRENFDSA